jgi:ABC-2 type transport system ATP-binding protein
MIEIQNISKDYGNKLAVKDLNLTLHEGEVFGLLGPNGAGKSTTIKMITGILNPTKGDVIIDGHSITQDALEAKRCFSFVSDTPDMFLGMTGIDYLSFLASVYKIDQKQFISKVEELSVEFAMKDALPDMIINYSHGMRQKIFIIGSLLHDPKNWILDEPMVGLDPEAAFTIKEIMRERAAAGKTIFFSTHVMEVAEKLCDRIGIIKKGKLVFIGTMAELQTQHGESGQSLEDIFLKLVAED